MNGPVLRDIHLPPAHGWPPAPGWWLLAALLVLAAVGVARWLRRAARTHPMRVAMHEIDALEAAHARDGDTGKLADGASRLMRRVALRIAPNVASQTGEAWHTFVHGHARDAATREALDGLIDVRFRAKPALDAPALLAALRNWCSDALRTSAPTPFHGKGGANANAREARAPKARGDETREAKAIPLNPPSFRRGKQKPAS